MAHLKSRSARFRAELKILIVGGGIAGLASAIRLRRGGFRPTIFEQAKKFQEAGAGIQIQPNAARILQQWGLSNELARHAATPKDLIIRSWKSGNILSRQNLAPYTQERYNAPFFVLHRADLHDVLRQEVERLEIPITLEAGIAAIDPQEPSVRLASNESVKADLILGCDGESSACRAMIPNFINAERRTSGDVAYRIILKLSELQQHPELQALIQNQSINTWWGPHSHVVTYSLPQRDSFNVFLAQVNTSKNIVKGPTPVPLSEVIAVFKDWNDSVQTLLKLAKSCRSWTLQDALPPKSFVHYKGKVALVGDAAHPMLPYLAQGAAQAIEDAEALGSSLASCRDSKDLPQALSTYQNARYDRAIEIQRRSSQMRAVHGYLDGPLQEERDRQLMYEEPFEGYPSPWSDPVFQKCLWS